MARLRRYLVAHPTSLGFLTLAVLAFGPLKYIW